MAEGEGDQGGRAVSLKRRVPEARQQTAPAILNRIAELPTPPNAILRRLYLDTASFCPESVARSRAIDQRSLRTVAGSLGSHVAVGFELARLAHGVLYQRDGSRLHRVCRSAFWEHAVTVASISDEILATRKQPNNDDRILLFAAGMLHDVGKLVLEHLVPKTYGRVLRLTEIRRLSLITTERDQLGLDHTQAGGVLADHWKLPGMMRDIITLHHAHHDAIRAISPRSAKQVAIAQLANALACHERFGHPAKTSTQAVDKLSADLDLSPADCAAITDRVAQRLKALRPARAIIATKEHTRWTTPRSAARNRDKSGTPNTSAQEPSMARMVAAVTRFTSTKWKGIRPGDVCAQIARCFCDVFKIDTAVAFCVNPTHAVYDCGACQRSDVTTASVAFDPHEPPAHTKWESTGMDLVDRMIIPSPALAAPVRRHFRNVIPGKLAYMLPIARPDSILDGVLFDADAPRVRQMNRRTDVIQMLGSTFGTIVELSRQRTYNTQIMQALTEANQGVEDLHRRTTYGRTLATVTEMGAGAAHELNTPLAVISGRAQWLAGRSSDETARGALTIIHEQCDRCSRIVNELISFAKPRPAKPASIALKTWFRRLASRWLTRFSFPADGIRISLADSQLRICADPEQLEEVFTALINNSLQAVSRESGRLVINSPSNSSDETVVIVVEDNGCGMPADVLDRACDPFFSHRKAGRGRGLGLSTALRLIENNGGRLWLESAQNRGTTAFVELPSGPRPASPVGGAGLLSLATM